ncbi:MAG: hypothetical protein VX764_07625 [Planctomycetota bacterium]|nr:hypothetical protein [Planctomycetota bacterium]
MAKPDKTVEELTSESKEVVRKIRFLIDAHHETVPGLAKGVGVLPETIQDVLDGQCHPSGALVRRIAERFSLPVEFFTGEVSFDIDPKRKKSGKAERSRVVSPKSKSTPAPVTRKKTRTTGTKEIASLQQSLIELLIQKGVISADEWNARIRLVARKSTEKS